MKASFKYHIHLGSLHFITPQHCLKTVVYKICEHTGVIKEGTTIWIAYNFDYLMQN
jgi:hypothetical protein